MVNSDKSLTIISEKSSVGTRTQGSSFHLDSCFFLVIPESICKWFTLEWENKAVGEPRCGVPPPLRVMPVTMTVIFIPEERTAAGTQQVEMASRTRNHKLERTQREILWWCGKDQKPKLPRESGV